LIRLLAFACALAAGCGTESGIQVTATSTGRVVGVDELQALVGHDGSSQTVSLVVSGGATDITAASPQVFTLLFDPSLSGEVTVQVSALAMSVALASAPPETVAIVPGEVVPLAVALPGQPTNDMATVDLFSTADFGLLPDFMSLPDLAEGGVSNDAAADGGSDDGASSDGASSDGASSDGSSADGATNGGTD
jgi:hypothetical protein